VLPTKVQHASLTLPGADAVRLVHGDRTQEAVVTAHLEGVAQAVRLQALRRGVQQGHRGSAAAAAVLVVVVGLGFRALGPYTSHFVSLTSASLSCEVGMIAEGPGTNGLKFWDKRFKVELKKQLNCGKALRCGGHARWRRGAAGPSCCSTPAPRASHYFIPHL